MSEPIADKILIRPLSGKPEATVRVPGSKSYTNRALAAASLAEGSSRLRGALFSDDTRYMAAALGQLGLHVAKDEDEAEKDEDEAEMEIVGCAGRIPERDVQVFVGNAGTAARFLTVLLSLGRGRYHLDGVERMRERPMADLLRALRHLGVTVECLGRPDCVPLIVSGASRSNWSLPAELTLPGTASSQFVSGLLLSAPHLAAGLTVNIEGRLVSQPYLDMTAQVMKSFGVEVENDAYQTFRVAAGQKYVGADYDVEPDASAASYFFAAAAITGGRITVRGLGTDSLQGDLRFVDVLERMGATVIREARSTTLIGPERLSGVEVDMRDLSDTAQTLAVVAPFAEGPTRITGIGFIRKKETDRVGAVVEELRRLGVTAVEEGDGMRISPGLPKPGQVRTYDDHRMAMSFALLGLRVPGIEILNPACTSKTFPRYWAVLDGLRR
jgi:3-phosphoshikimate 1-carboxyvinyltransferase